MTVTQAGAIEASWVGSDRVPMSALLSWAGGSCSSHEHIEIPLALAEGLRMRDGLEIEVKLKKGIPMATRVDVEPLGPDDWENTLIRLNVTATHSSPAARSVLLAPNTEVVVCPKVRRGVPPAVALADEARTVLRVAAAEWLECSRDAMCVYVGETTAAKMQLPPQGALFMLQPIDKTSTQGTDATSAPARACVVVKAASDAFAHHVHLALCVRVQCGSDCGSTVQLTRLIGTPPPARAIGLAAVTWHGGGRTDGSVDLKDSFRQWVQRIAPVSKRACVMCEGTLVCLKEYSAGTTQLGTPLEGTCCGNGKSEDARCIGVHVRVSFRVEGENKGDGMEVFSLDLASLPRDIRITDDLNWQVADEPLLYGPPASSLGGLQPLMTKLLNEVDSIICGREARRKLGTPFPGGILLYGASGCGKTTMAKIVCHYMRKHSGSSCYLEVLQCANLASSQRFHAGKDKQPTTLARLDASIRKASARSPSILLLDDIDVLAPAQDASQRDSDGGKGAATAAIVVDVLRRMKHNASMNPRRGTPPCVIVIATARAVTSVDEMLIKSRVLDSFYEVPPPNEAARLEILKAILKSGDIAVEGELVVHGGSLCLDGFSGEDLHTLAKRVQITATARWLDCAQGKGGSCPNGVPIITAQDVRDALEGYVPAALRNVKAESVAKWEDVGGLNTAKKTLIDTVELPARFPSIFAKAPLRVRTGALVYGPPGSGKTMLVGALASRCGINFISVKGPELLNKYIGASEQGVRDVFARASAAKPCMLFFDEFDSIAPHRGHDSTGVTDRVVNQLLTALDGVEGLEGVFVVAATSRPDLIDKALLRPGRLDMHVHCDMPGEDEREDILRRVLSKLQCHESVDATIIAARTQRFNGADLQALVYNAQLMAAHEAIDSNNMGGGPPQVRGEHLEKSLHETRPSLSEAERMRLDAIYQEFAGERQGAKLDDSAAAKWRKAAGKKSTLA